MLIGLGAPAAGAAPTAVPADIPRNATQLMSPRQRCGLTVRATDGFRVSDSGRRQQR